MHVPGLAAFLLASVSAAPAPAVDWCPVPVDQAQAWLKDHPLQLPPNGALPHALAQVHTEGTLPHRGIRDQSLEAERDWPAMLHAALVWRAGVNEKSFDTARRFLFGWVGTYTPNLNPIDKPISMR